MADKDKSLLDSNFLNFIPAVCSFLVVMIHCYNVSGLSAMSFPFVAINFISHGLAMGAVPTFFFVSGYLFFRNINRFDEIWEKQKKRLVSLVLPFLIWSALYYVLYAALGTILPGLGVMQITFKTVVRGIFFYEFVYPMWYMFQLIVYVFLGSAIIFVLLKNRMITTAIVGLLIWVGVFVYEGITVNIGHLSRPLLLFEYLGYYLLGCLLSRIELPEQATSVLSKLPISILTIAFVLGAILESVAFAEVFPILPKRCFVPLVFVTFLMLALKVCGTDKKLPRLGFSPIIIYAVHPFWIAVIDSAVLSRLSISQGWSFCVRVVAVEIFSFATGYVIKRIKPVYYVLSGGR